MRNITREECVNELKQLFDLDDTFVPEKGYVSYNKEKETTTFWVDKRYMWRLDVIDVLKEYFKDKYIVDGQCRIDSITLVYTWFHIEPVTDDNHRH